MMEEPARRRNSLRHREQARSCNRRTPAQAWPADLLSLGSRRQSLLIAFQRFVVALQPVADPALGKIRDGHFWIGLDGAIVALEGIVILLQLLQRLTLFDQRLGMVSVELQNLIVAGHRLGGPVPVI